MKRIHAIIIWIAILPIIIYKWFISPLIPMACRHVPTCSEYAIEALKVHGLMRGSYLAIHRIVRCNPWGSHGFDPVPPRKIKVKKLDTQNL